MFNRTTPEDDESLRAKAHEVPDLCHKCGRCCRSATTYNSYQKLQELVAAGDQEATNFLSIFEPYPSIEAAREVVPEQVEQVLRVLAERKDIPLDEVTFYHCRYVTEEGLCGIYERRPRVCKEAPYNGWSVMPPGCGFEGWQFAQRESHKAEIRKLKEMQYRMEQLSPDGVHLPTRNMTLDDLREVVNQSIAPWKSYGSEYW